ncbi:fasciclin domain-containing protein [Hirsutella rhossiliensis]|uniref:Fasciclin domain-containing protein n=1 Tax=Hirsutella rhossiliensis TaxID=111463 RepID=A0A9P8MZ58_9HYPO|nr:fasciclin domain-containing protein [Hirsutella rhossiliensis]KAH0963909.1 fasciclin domain-containing protein [Hirsutella rhossiliensis]
MLPFKMLPPKMLPPKMLSGLAAGLFLLLPFVAAAGEQQDLGSVLEASQDLSKFYDLLKKYPEILLQLPSYTGVTIIAPTNEAFDRIPYTSLNAAWDPADKAKTVPLLQYHMIRGTLATDDDAALSPGPTRARATLLVDRAYANVSAGQTVLAAKQPAGAVVFTSGLGSRCSVVESDLRFQGGVVHAVDNLLVPPARLAQTARAFGLTSFLGALYAAGLMPAVADRSNVTVFAPQDAAFALVGGGLEKMKTAELARVMSYHIVRGQVLVSSALANGSKLETLAAPSEAGTPRPVTIRQAGNNKYVDSAQIIQPDILIANGVLHVVSSVLSPDAGTAAVPNPDSAIQPPVFPVSRARHPFTSALPCTTNCPVASSDVLEAASTPSTTFFLASSSKGVGAPGAACTAHVAGAAAIGLLGVGAGLAPWL